MRTLIKKIIFWKITLEAKIILRKYKPKIVAITGSVGKTSTKDAINLGLGTHLYTRASQKSYNSEIGVPLAIIGRETGWGSLRKWTSNIIEGFILIILKNHYPKWLILELGIDRPGDMENITKWVKPDIAVFTRFSKVPVHVEFFSSPEAVIKEKKKLAQALKSDGTLILNHDDPDVLEIREAGGKKVLTYGFSEKADIRASGLEILYQDDKPHGITFRIDLDGKSLPVTLKGVLGKQHVYPTLATVAVAKVLELNLVEVIWAFGNYFPAPGRMRILKGVRESVLIDDSYNSSPIALESALKVLGEVKGRRKVAILGDMMELGKYEKEEHRKGGEKAREVADLLITVGSKAIRAKGMGAKIHFKDSVEAAQKIPRFIREGDIVLIKGSESARMEKVVERILAKPKDARNLLVRQEDEWMKR